MEGNALTQKKKVQSPRRAGKQAIGSKLSRSEILTVRLDPKLRFAAELAARKHRRTLSSFTEWAVEQAVKRLPLNIHATQVKGEEWASAIPDELPVGECLQFLKKLSLGQWEITKKTANEIVEEVWDPDESRRFAQLASNYPELLTHDEDVLWKRIKETYSVWRHKGAGPQAPRTYIRYPELKRQWDALNRAARREAE